MTQTVDEVYRLNLASSSKLKLRAKGLLAEGAPEDVFEACVLLHNAARLDYEAISPLPTCPPVTRLSSAAEQCGCYVEGRDPPRAAEVWCQVLQASQGVDARTAEAILARVTPRFESARREFARTLKSTPMLLAMLLAARNAESLAVLSEAERGRARDELASVLAKFPGTASFWWLQYRLAEADDRKQEAWDALSRARRLAPHDSRFAWRFGQPK